MSSIFKNICLVISRMVTSGRLTFVSLDKSQG
jgi:hypothetical protein